MKAGRGVQRIESHDVEPVLGSDMPSLEEDTLSLEQLGKVYAEMLSVGVATSSKVSEVDSQLEKHNSDQVTGVSVEPESLTLGPVTSENSSADRSEEELAITPERIVEALLFVGQPEGKSLTSNQIASTMRGVGAEEIPEFVERLNRLYESTGRVMRIDQQQDGFVLRVAEQMQRSTNTIQGKLRETRLPPAAVDCLALVAYNPGATREEIEKLWNQSASSMLGLLVRKELLEIVREDAPKAKSKLKNQKSPVARYHPTERFLNLLGLSSLHDLPRVDSDL